MSLEGASAALNAGQAIILSAGLTAVLVAAIKTGGGITPGDLVRGRAGGAAEARCCPALHDAYIWPVLPDAHSLPRDRHVNFLPSALAAALPAGPLLAELGNLLPSLTAGPPDLPPAAAVVQAAGCRTLVCRLPASSLPSSQSQQNPPSHPPCHPLTATPLLQQHPLFLPSASGPDPGHAAAAVGAPQLPGLVLQGAEAGESPSSNDNGIRPTPSVRSSGSAL